MTPFFSIVIPTYNRADSIQLTLDACWQQTDSDFEVILVDDGSSDDTETIIQQINEPRLRYIRQHNAGPAAARNNGMRQARGQYIAFLDSDDIWYPGHLSAVRAAINAGHDFVYSQIIVDRGVNRYWIKPDRAIAAEENIFDYLYKDGGFIQTSTMVISSELATQVSWNEDVTYGDNDQFAIDLWLRGAKPVMLDKPYTLYCDVIQSDALSKMSLFGAAETSKYTNFFDWMAIHRKHMSQEAWLGFEAHHRSPAIARSAPGQCFGLIWQAYRAGAIGLIGLVRQVIQTFAPKTYRRLVDNFVRFRGAPLEQLRP